MIDSRPRVFVEAGFNQDTFRNSQTGSAGAVAGGFLADLMGRATLRAATVSDSAVALPVEVGPPGAEGGLPMLDRVPCV